MERFFAPVYSGGGLYQFPVQTARGWEDRLVLFCGVQYDGAIVVNVQRQLRKTEG